MNTSLHCKSPSHCTASVLYLYGKTDSTKFPDLYKNNELTITTFCLAATAGHLLQPSSTNNNFKISTKKFTSKFVKMINFGKRKKIQNSSIMMLRTAH